MKTIALYPWDESLLNDQAFNDKNIYNLIPDNNLYDKSNVLLYLKQELHKLNYDLKTIDLVDDLSKCEYIFFFNVQKINNIFWQKCIHGNFKNMILFIWEPNIGYSQNYFLKNHKYFDKIFTWNDNWIDQKKYIKFYYPNPEIYDCIYNVEFKNKKFSTLIAGEHYSNAKNELYSERIKIINFMNKKSNQFDFYGRGWQSDLRSFLRFFKRGIWNNKKLYYSSYKGQAKNKLKTLSEYKFTFCLENCFGYNGYISEKIFDCFYARSIPIYWGASNINTYIPKDCYIDYTGFESLEELYQYLNYMDEKTYKTYIFNIEKFLKSDKFYLFTDRFFVENIINNLVEDKNK